MVEKTKAKAKPKKKPLPKIEIPNMNAKKRPNITIAVTKAVDVHNGHTLYSGFMVAKDMPDIGNVDAINIDEGMDGSLEGSQRFTDTARCEKIAKKMEATLQAGGYISFGPIILATVEGHNGLVFNRGKLTIKKPVLYIDGGHRRKIIEIVKANPKRFPCLDEYIQKAPIAVETHGEMSLKNCQDLFVQYNGGRKDVDRSQLLFMQSSDTIGMINAGQRVKRTAYVKALSARVWADLYKDKDSSWYHFVDLDGSFACKGPGRGKPPKLTELARTVQPMIRNLIDSGDISLSVDDEGCVIFEDQTHEEHLAIVKMCVEKFWGHIKTNQSDAFQLPDEYVLRNKGVKVANQILGIWIKFSRMDKKEFVEKYGDMTLEQSLEEPLAEALGATNSYFSPALEDYWSFGGDHGAWTTDSGSVRKQVRLAWMNMRTANIPKQEWKTYAPQGK